MASAGWVASAGLLLGAVLGLSLLGEAPGRATAPIGLGGSAPAVVDGDTVRHGGRIVRLVGFDAPETGANARCAGEEERGRRATERLRELIRSARDVDLRHVPCVCPPATQGTSDCNYGRACGLLRLDGRDAGHVLIAEGLARPYRCGPTGCPRRQPWC